MTLLMQYSNHMVSCVITDVQLVDGPSSNKGTVEIKQDGGDWETTCGINLDTNDVIVICRQLRFTGASLAMTATPYGQNSIPAIGLHCNGSEGNLSACSTSSHTSECSPAGAASCHGDGYLGCFVDMKGDRVLSGDSLENFSMMTIPYCIQFCQGSTTANYVYAGVESGNECYCGKASDNYTRHREGVDADCSFPCHGDPTESCGGSGYIAVFTSLYAGIGGGVAAVVIVLIVIVAIVCFRKRRSHQRTKGIVSSQRATLSPASRPPAYDEIYDFGIPNGAMADSSSARGFQPGSQAHSSAKSRGHNKVLLVNLNPKKSSNIYEGTMDETSDDEPTRNPSRGTTAVPQNRTDRLSVHYAMPDKNGNEAQDGYDEINLGIAPYSSFENPEKPTAPAKMADRMSVVYAAPDKNGGRNVTSDDLDSLYAMPDKNGNRNPSDDSSEDVGSLYAMPDKSRGKPDGYDGDQDLYAIANDSFSGDQLDEMEMVDNELYTM
ncbi:uncharacterized protein LOC121430573 [Lytechinus variegatus]|uniref:uncharacterized protein LOC121430573 n=1 Tax=Lytechinus variegatus TaxID=7654 RepID=UPI001BB23ADC|nr:uncharacterized protein LOC121430573 [Lytechinus variegatus]